MGNSSQTISYDCGSKYIGQVRNSLPHGKGIIYVSKNSPSFNHKIQSNKENFNEIQTEFENGNIKKVNIKLKSGFTYLGTLQQNNTQQGKLTDTQKTSYEGNFQQGHLTKGKITSLSTTHQHQMAYICQTSGEFIGTSIINGQSIFYNISEKYVASGEFYKGKLSRGCYFYENGDRCEGEFKQGMMYGQGTYCTGDWVEEDRQKIDEKNKQEDNQYTTELLKNNPPTNNNIAFCFTGQFQSGHPSGKGQVTFSNSHQYKGKFKHGKYHNYGQYTFPDNTIYKGSFYCGQMTGQCAIQFTPRSKINLNKQKHQLLQKYQGEVSNGIFHGLGILYYENGVIFKGYFLNGAKNGPGVLIYCQSKWKCLYVMNKLVGQLEEIGDE